MSKGLEALENHKLVLKALGHNHCEEWENLKDIEKSLKALEIIKSKPVNTNWFVFYKDYDEYYLNCEYADTSKKLTEEEYNLLKEVLK